MRNKLTIVKEEHQLTVKELLKLLKEHPDKMKIFTEGCDCVGEAAGIRIFKDVNGKEALMISRL